MSSLRRPNAPAARSRQNAEVNENRFQEVPLSISIPTHHHPHRPPLNSIQDPYLTPGSKEGQLSGAESVKEPTPFQRSAQSTPVSARSSCFSSCKNGVRVTSSHVGGRERDRMAPGSSRAFRGSLLDSKPWMPVESVHFELEEDPSFWKDHNVQVLIRIRPISSLEGGAQENGLCLRQDSSKSLTWMGHPEARFTFDHVASETISQEKLFKVVGVPMVENCMSGYNSCMFAYGQTGSGKTYTMMGQISERDGTLSEDCGMTPRIFEYLFTRIQEEEASRRNEKLKYTCKCSFLEIYNEQITDLLDPSSTNLQLREDLKKGVYVENLSEYEVNTVKEVISILLQGSSNRKMAATYMNSESSRSHSLFTCAIESRWEKDTRTHLRFSRLNLVDLAGSERQKSSGVEGERLREAANINRSLSTLGLVIMTLVDIANGKSRHVPYRDSRLTFLLQDSLGGNSKTIIIANISPSICSSSETLSTLKFAQRAKLIQNNAKVNEDASGDIMSLQKQIQVLKDQVMFLNKCHSVLPPRDSASECHETLQKNCSSSMGNLHCNQAEKQEVNFHHPVLIGALRREKEAYDSIRHLEAENESLNCLVNQLQDAAERSKKIIEFRDEKIRQLELVAEGALSTEKYLIEENIALSKEILLLQEKAERNPQLTYLSVENVRNVEKLRVYHEFHHQGERELLLDEISNLRDQLLRYVEGTAPETESTLDDSNAGSGIKSTGEFFNSIDELGDCREQLAACLKLNAELTRELESLRSQLKILEYKRCTEDLDVLMSVEAESDDGSSIGDINHPMNDTSTVSSLVDHVSYPKLEKMQPDLSEKEKLNTKLQSGYIIKRSIHIDMEQAQQEVKGERTTTMLYLQEDDCKLKESANVNEACHSLIGKSTGDLITENQALKESLDQTTKENTRLNELLTTRERIISTVDDEWEKAVMDLANFLIESFESLEDASKQIEAIMDSFPRKKTLVHEHVGRAIFTFIEKERLIVNLQKKLENAQKVVSDMTEKMTSLRGAALTLSEVHLQDNDEVASELIHLRKLLNDNLVTFQAKKLTFKHNGICKESMDLYMDNCKPSDNKWSDTREVEDTHESVGALTRFDKAQDTIQEAGLILGSLLSVNDRLMKGKNAFEQSNKELQENIATMEFEMQGLRDSKSMILEQNRLVQEKVHESYSGMLSTLSFLEFSFKKLQEQVAEVLAGVYSDFLSARHDLDDFIKNSKSWFETVVFTMMERDFFYLVTYHCYVTAFADALTSFSSDSHGANTKGDKYKMLCNFAMQHYDKFTGLPGGSGLGFHDMCSLLLQSNQTSKSSMDNLYRKLSFHSDTADNTVSGSNKGCTSGPKDFFKIPYNSNGSLHAESSSESNPLENGSQQPISSMNMLQDELAMKAEQVDKLLAKASDLEAELRDIRKTLNHSRSELDATKEAMSLLLIKKIELEDHLRNVSAKLLGYDAELEMKTKIINSLEREIIFMRSTSVNTPFSDGKIEDELKKVSEERDHLAAEVVSLKDKLELVSSLADENEAIAVEARQVSESNRSYAEQKEEEVKVLEHSIVELEETINVLESKVIGMVNEVESNRIARSDLEEELQLLRQRLMMIENTTEQHDMSGKIGKEIEPNEASNYIEDLEQEVARKANEIQKYKDYISELVLHSEAQSALYQNKFKMLEEMIESEDKRSSSTSQTNHQNKAENGPIRTRASGSPFRCISNLVQQVNSEKEKELSVARLQIEQLEDLAANRQKQVCVLTARLAEVDTMTHDVIRDLLEVKLDMSNYAKMVENDELQRLLLEVRQQNNDNFVKGQEITNLREQINVFAEERNRWTEEMSRLREEIFATKCTLEQVQQRGQLLKAQNEMLKVDKVNLTRKITEYDEMVKKLAGSPSMHDFIYSRNDDLDVNCSRIFEDGFARRLAEADKLLFHTQNEVARKQNSKSHNF